MDGDPMTLYVPDISHHQGDISIQGLIDAGAAAVIARVGQGAGSRTNGGSYATTRDRKWARNLAEAKRLGLTIAPYWYIGNLISADDNARLAAEWVGDTSLPWMLDHEDASGSIGFYRDVLAAFGRRGLRVVLSYIPQWYWSGAGQRASLVGLPPLVASRYVAAGGPPAAIYPGDGGAGWAGYGGNTVALWQFTNKASMAQQLVDCSAFRGTKAQLAALLGGGQEDDMSWDQRLTFESPGSRTRPPDTPPYFESHSAAEALGDTMFYASDANRTAQRIEVKLDALGNNLSNWEAEVLASLRALPAGDVDEAALAGALGPILAPLVHAGATPEQVEAAVRRVFADASGPDGS